MKTTENNNATRAGWPLGDTNSDLVGAEDGLNDYRRDENGLDGAENGLDDYRMDENGLDEMEDLDEMWDVNDIFNHPPL